MYALYICITKGFELFPKKRCIIVFIIIESGTQIQIMLYFQRELLTPTLILDVHISFQGIYDLHIEIMGIPLLPWEPSEMCYMVTAK